MPFTYAPLPSPNPTNIQSETAIQTPPVSLIKVEALANSVPDKRGVYFVPAFVGLGAPHWDSYARGGIFGLTRGSSAGHIARAALESIAYQVADLMDAVQTDTNTPLQELCVDGGASPMTASCNFKPTFSVCPWGDLP
jgi:glycerol kinase